MRAAVKITEGQGLDATIERLALDRHPTIGAVYSIGGGNVATIRAFGQRSRRYRVFIAHDLDEDNRMLLRAAGSRPCYITTREPMPTGPAA